MPPRRLIQTLRRFPVRLFRRQTVTPGHSDTFRDFSRPEFESVAEVAGREPLQPELSGLEIRYPYKQPARVSSLWTELAYRWHPSGEYRRRQGEIREMNRRMREEASRPSSPPPPILFYADASDVEPIRKEGDARRRGAATPWSRQKPLDDLTDLEQAAIPRNTWIVQPTLPEADPEYLRPYRHLLTRPQRTFLLHSRYPRAIAIAVLSLGTFLGALWVNQVQHAEAVAASHFQLARQAFQAEISGARSYGVELNALSQIEAKAGELAAARPPSGLIITPGRADFYREQERQYRDLVSQLRLLKRQAWLYWSAKERTTYSALSSAVQSANSAGLAQHLPAIPACATAACYQRAVSSEVSSTRWLDLTVAKLNRYAGEVASSDDPATTAANYLQQARALQDVAPPGTALVSALPDLDTAYANAATTSDYARVGALARLDANTLHAALIKSLPGRAVVVSITGGKLTCYQQRKVAFTSPVATGTATPSGVFHIQGKEASIPATYWYRPFRLLHSRYGVLPDWMSFSGAAALQSAPWRPWLQSGDPTIPGYAPSTPTSIDLPPAAANFLFQWVALGTEVVVY